MGALAVVDYLRSLTYGAIAWVGYNVFGSRLSKQSQKFFLQIFVVALLFVFLLFVAVLVYVLFYWNYIPKVSHSLPVYFDFPSEGIQKKLPVAVIPLKLPGSDYKVLSSGQLYDISLKMTLPESNRNLDLSNFMVELLGQDSQNITINIAKRPALLHHKTPLARYITTLWRIVPLLLGFFPEKQELELPLLENFVETGADWFLVRLSNPSVQVYGASLQIDAHFQGLRFFMYYWFFSTAGVIISIIMFWETLLAFIFFKLLQNLYQQNYKKLKVLENAAQRATSLGARPDARRAVAEDSSSSSSSLSYSSYSPSMSSGPPVSIDTASQRMRDNAQYYNSNAIGPSSGSSHGSSGEESDIPVQAQPSGKPAAAVGSVAAFRPSLGSNGLLKRKMKGNPPP